MLSSLGLVFSAAEARRAGIPSRMLAYYCVRGVIERLGKGVYRRVSLELDLDLQWQELLLVALSIPNGVICMISALCYYQLTDEIMRECWLAIPHQCTAPKRAHVHIVRMRNVTLGRTTIQLGGYTVKIFDRERSVIDAFRYLDKEIAIKALQGYLQVQGNWRPDLAKLAAYAKKLRVDLTPYIMALTT